MKSVFNKIKKEKSKEIVFPVLAEHIDSGVVVMFIDYTKGVIVHGDENLFSDRYYDGYINIESEQNWRILSPEESIVLNND